MGFTGGLAGAGLAAVFVRGRPELSGPLVGVVLLESLLLSRFAMVSGVLPLSRAVALSAGELAAAEAVPESTDGRWLVPLEQADPTMISVPARSWAGRRLSRE